MCGWGLICPWQHKSSTRYCSTSTSAHLRLAFVGCFWDLSVEPCSIHLVSDLLTLCRKLGSCPVSSLKISLTSCWVLNDYRKNSPFCQLNLRSAKHEEEKTQCHSKYCLFTSITNPLWSKITKLVDSFRGPLWIQKCKKCVCVLFFCILFSKLLIVHVCV